MLRDKLKSRPTLFTIAAIGLLLAHVSDFLALSKHQSSLFGLIGNLLFFGAFLAVIPVHEQREEERLSDSSRTAMISCITASLLLIANGFIPNPHWLHGLLGIAAYAMMFFCWSLPNSRWAAITFLPIYAMALLQIKWRVFANLLRVPPWIWVLACVAWILISLVAFRLIDKREHAQLGVELN